MKFFITILTLVAGLALAFPDENPNENPNENSCLVCWSTEMTECGW